MNPRTQNRSWQVVGESRRGASHVHSGLKNQDSLEYWVSDGSGTAAVLAVADGHGSAMCFRSDVGSKLAVEAAVRVLRDVAPQLRAESGPAPTAQKFEGEIPATLVRTWRESVQRHFETMPVADSEWDSLESQSGAADAERVRRDPFLAYGSTLLAALVTDAFILYLQLGDGDVLGVTANGLTRRKIDRDEQLIANQTYSICQPGAERYVRLGLEPITAESPVLILLATDGYSNSFVTDEDFLQIGHDYLETIRNTGLESVERSLAGWLDETSLKGSGDDITVGVMVSDRIGSPLAGSDAEIEEEIPVSLAEKLTQQLHHAEQRLSDLESAQSRLSRKIRALNLGLVVAGLVAATALVLVVRPFLATRMAARSASPPAVVQTAKPDASTMRLRLDSGRTLDIRPGQELSTRDVGLKGKGATLASVVGTNDPGRMTLVNRSEETWDVSQRGGSPIQVKPGGEVTVGQGTQIRVGQTTLTIP